MSKAFEEIYEGLHEAICHAKGEPTQIIEHPPLSVQEKTGLNQQQLNEINYLKNLSDEDIDTSDIPEITDWTGFKKLK